MRAVTIHDGELDWAEHPDPAPGRGELLVSVRAAGLNRADLLQRRGFYPAPPGSPPDIPGLELAGVVVGTGAGVADFAPGDRVMAVVGGGGQAELAVIHERVALPVPEAVSWAEAGGFPETFTTAYDALFSQCGLTAGERVLIHGAAGGVGTAAVQLATAAGAEVIATVRNAALRAPVEALAAGIRAIDPDGFTAHGPFDVVLELVGGPNLEGDIDALATGGRIAVIGVGGGASASVNLLTLMARRGRVHGSTLRSRPLEAKAQAAQAVRTHVLALLASGRLRVPVEATYPISEAGRGYAHFEAGAKFGKIVLVAPSHDRDDQTAV